MAIICINKAGWKLQNNIEISCKIFRLLCNNIFVMLEYLLRISFDVLTIERLEMEIVAAVTLAGFSQGSDRLICEYIIVFIEALSLSLSLSILYKGIGFSLTIEEGGGEGSQPFKNIFEKYECISMVSTIHCFQFPVSSSYRIPSS